MKFCQSCGLQNNDTSIYCARCGSALSGNIGTGGPAVVVVGNGQQQTPVGSNPGTVWLWLNIVLTLLCCSILSIIGIIFGAMSVSKYNNGLYGESKSNASTAKVLFIIGLILGVLSVIGMVIYVVLMGGIMAIPIIGELLNGGY